MKQQKRFLGLVLVLLTGAFPVPIAIAQNPTVSLVSANRAYQETTLVTIFPGRTSIIDFRNGERITYIRLANHERIVFDTNAPVETGTAHLIVLNLIEPLPFDGQTRPPGFRLQPNTPKANQLPRPPATNLTVVTINRSRQTRTYIFDLVPMAGNPGAGDTNGVAIVSEDNPELTLTVSASTNPSQSANFQTSPLKTDLGTATLSDISRGLEVAIENHYTPADDPIVFQVKELMALAQNGIPLIEAAEKLNIPLSVLVSLGEIGLLDQTQRHFEQFPPTPPTESVRGHSQKAQILYYKPNLSH